MAADWTGVCNRLAACLYTGRSILVVFKNRSLLLDSDYYIRMAHG
jgi:hypothetical protein